MEAAAIAHEETAPVANVAGHLPRVAALRPFAPAIYFPDGRDSRGRVRYTHYTYRQLDEASDRIAKGLGAMGLEPGTRVALMVQPSLELFSLVFGLFKARLVPVMVDPGIGLKNMKACLANGRPDVFIGIPKAQLARVILRWAPSVRTVITVGRRGPWGGVTLDEVERRGAEVKGDALVPTRPDDMAAILFTSGSTGPPKGAVYTHGNFTAQVDAIRQLYDIRGGEIDLPTFPLFALFDPALGMTTVIPDMDPTRPAQADPRKIAEAIEDFGVTNMFGSPALLNALGRWGEAEGRELPSLKRVISAGAPVPGHVLQRIRAMLPSDGQVVTPYGATECLPVASVESREVLGETGQKTAEGHGVCVGRVVSEAEVAIIAIHDGPIADWSEVEVLEAGEIGEIVVKGPQATRRYWNADQHTALAKIPDGDAVRHRMGDLGYLDDGGRLWFCGRKSQRVETDERPYYSGQVEGVFNDHPTVYRSALVRANGAPAVCLELEKGASAPPDEELRALADRHDATRGLDAFHVHPGFPVDIRHNAKIKREQLGVWASSR